MLNLEVEGVNDFVMKLNRLQWKEAINRGIKKSIFTIERQSKIETPVDTGILRNSYETTFNDLIGKLTNFREYGIYVHEGTRYQKANPFMMRAVEKTENDVEIIFSNELDALLATLK